MIRAIVIAILSFAPLALADESFYINTPSIPYSDLHTPIIIYPEMFHFSDGGKTIVSVSLTTGKVTLGEGVTLDEASKAFWDAVGREAIRCGK